jgi:lysophosphatidate acyltransferase
VLTFHDLVLDPIPTKGLTAADVDDLARTTRDLMLRELITLSEKAQGRPMAFPANEQPAQARSSGVDKLAA